MTTYQRERSPEWLEKYHYVLQTSWQQLYNSLVNKNIYPTRTIKYQHN